VTSNQEFLKRTCVVEVLLVGVDRYGDRAFDTKVSDSVEGVVA